MNPIIDVHAHIFNAMGIPLKGYLRSRKYEGILKYLAPLLIPIVARCVRGKLNTELRGNLLYKLLCPLALKIAYMVTGKEYKKWVATLSKTVPEITSELVETYKNDGIDLFVPLMVDYEYWFRNTADTPWKEQVDFISKQIILPYKGTIHPFIAFDPARELAFRKGMKDPDGNPEKYGSFGLVKDAIEKWGFIGIKLYNAMGYKPFYNNTTDDRRRRIGRHKKYAFKGEEYDKVLSELYDYCIEKEVPITTHCGMDGIESYHDASFDYGHAILWRDVFGQERYKNLRLNLAHYGWNKIYHHQGNRSWVKEICEMLGKYPFLFTDVSHHEVCSKDNIPVFKSAYQELCHDYPVIKKRLLFGVDWHVIKRVKDFTRFKDTYIEILKDEDLFTDEEIADFLGGNSMKFLGLHPGGKNRERLEAYYNNNNIDPPAWFIATESLNTDN